MDRGVKEMFASEEEERQILKDEIEKLRNRLGGTDGGANIWKL